MFRGHRALALGLALSCAACGGKGDDDDTDPTGTTGDDDDETGETDTWTPVTDGPKRVMEYSIGGFFGYDDTLEQIVPLTNVYGELVESRFYLEFRSTDYSGGCTEETCCYVVMVMDGYTGEQASVDAGWAFGTHTPQGAPTGWETCTDAGFDPADPAWGGSDPFTYWADAVHGWGFNIGGPPSSTVTEWTGGDDPYLLTIGGELLSTTVGNQDTIYFESWEVDENMAIIDDARVDVGSIVDGNGKLVTGYYQFDVMVHYDF